MPDKRTHKHLRGPEFLLVAGFRLQCQPIKMRFHLVSGKVVSGVYSRIQLNELDAMASECKRCNGEVKSVLAQMQKRKNLQYGVREAAGKIYFEFDLKKFEKTDMIASSLKIAHVVISAIAHHPKLGEMGVKIKSINIVGDSILKISADLVRKEESDGLRTIHQILRLEMEKFFH